MDPLIAPFLERAAREPERPMCRTSGRSSRRSLCAGEVAGLARLAADRATALGLGPTSLVALVAPSGPAFVAAYAGLRSVGAVVLLVDATTPIDEQRRVATRMGARAVWREHEGWTERPGEDVELLASATAPLADAAAYKLTSGSTGEPSAIAVSADALLADAVALASSMGLRADDRFAVAIPMSHSYGFSVLTSPALLLGSELVFAGPDEQPLEAARACQATVLPAVPSWFRAIAEVTSAADWPPSLRLLLSAGAPLPRETARAVRERFGLPIHVLYGSSECGGITYDRRGDAAERGGVGTPVEGARIELVGASPGIVSVRSNAVALGYVRADESLRARLGNGRFETEDLARFEDGELFLEGRRSEWINVKGKKVNPREVEAVIGKLEGVREVVVVAQPVPGLDGEIVRSVIACPEGTLTWHDVVAWCRPRLCAHKIPRSVVVVPEIPRNERGKVDRRALLALSPSSRDSARRA